MFSKLPPPLVQVSVRYGLIASIIGLILLVSLYYMDKHPFLIPPFLDFRIIIFSVFVVFALRELREFYFGGILFFWQGMIASFILTFVFAFSASLFLLLFTYLQPDFVSSYIKLSTAQLKEFTAEEITRLGKDTYDQVVANLKMADGWFMAKRYFFQSFLISFLISVIISVILRRQPKPF